MTKSQVLDRNRNDQSVIYLHDDAIFKPVNSNSFPELYFKDSDLVDENSPSGSESYTWRRPLNIDFVAGVASDFEFPHLRV